MTHKQGGKITSSHTTVTELSGEVVGFLEKCETVSKISIGVLINSAEASGSIWTVKIIDEQNCVLVKTTQKSTNQELRFYTNSPEARQNAKLELSEFVRNKRWKLRFGSHINIT